MKKPTHITIRRWFQRLYGNTYFSATVHFDDGTSDIAIPFEYGYGDHGLYQAVEWLGKQGYVTLPAPHSNGMKSYNPTVLLRESLGCSYDIIDVNRKKDM